MIRQILRIKTSIPPIGENILSRPQVLERLDRDLIAAKGFTRQLTLFSASAGFGKTTMVRKWLDGREANTAWFSLDEGDNDPEHFWIYLISALQALHGNIGKASMEALHSMGIMGESTGSFDNVIAPLLNDLFSLEQPSFLVLDDYHMISSSRIHEDMVFFIENLPPTLHLVVTTRSDPHWPLVRWRGKGRMEEIRTRQLKFMKEETHQLFTDIKGIHLNESQLHILLDKTEGWITGLNLAAFSLATCSSTDDFINNFAGSHRHILNFLGDEVYKRQPEYFQDFLLKTSVLSRFNPQLCDMVTGRNDSTDILARLERENLFVIPLDDEGVWYRYHHLFSELLVYYLKRKYPYEYPNLHERAAEWFQKSDEPSEAIRHALLCNNLERVASIIHKHHERIVETEGAGQLIRCYELIPTELLRKYPRLTAMKAFYLMVLKGMEQVDDYLRIAEELSYEDYREQEEYSGLLAAIKAYYYINNHNFQEASIYAEEALTKMSSGSNFWRMGIAIFLGDVRFFTGDPKGSLQYYLEAHKSNKKIENPYYLLSSGIKLGINLYYLGRLRESEELVRDMLALIRKEGFSKIGKSGTMWVLMGDLLREKGNLDEAERCVDRGLQISKGEKPYLGWNYISRIALSFTQKNYHDAMTCIRQIKAINDEVTLPAYVMSAQAEWEARLHIEMGNLSEAENILSRMGISRKTEVRAGQEWGYLVLARILIEEDNDNFDLIDSRLDSIQKLCTVGDNRKVLMEALLVRSFFAEKNGRFERAQNCMLSALKMGLESGYFQTIIDEGEKLSAILLRIIEDMKRNNIHGRDRELLEYTKKIRSYINSDGDFSFDRGASHEKDTTLEDNSCSDLVEDLSPRELEILGYISKGHTNQDISKELYLSLGTVKWHTSNIYGKLGVRSRTQAVDMARKLNLL